MLFEFKWYRCRDQYRVATLAASETILSDGLIKPRRAMCIIPNSDNWEEYRPLDTPAPYRAFARFVGERINSVGKAQASVEIANAYGSMEIPRAPYETVRNMIDYSVGIREIVDKIDAADWDWIKQSFDRRRYVVDQRRRPVPGFGQLQTAFEVEAGRPKFRLTPPTLFDALYAQALFDAEHGIEHKACKNPECERFFPISGPDAYRKDALYCCDACRARYVYLKKTGVVS